MVTNMLLTMMQQMEWYPEVFAGEQCRRCWAEREIWEHIRTCPKIDAITQETALAACLEPIRQVCGSDLIKYGIAVGALIHNDGPLKDETLLLGMLLLQQERVLKELQLSPNKARKL